MLVSQIVLPQRNGSSGFIAAFQQKKSYYQLFSLSGYVWTSTASLTSQQLHFEVALSAAVSFLSANWKSGVNQGPGNK